MAPLSNTVFDVLILIARPAAGKSEVIRYLKNLPPGIRVERFHLGRIDEIDDFPMLWTWFEEDELLQKMDRPRLHTTTEGFFRWQYLWDVLMRRIELEYHKRRRNQADDAEPVTTLIEFSRGKEHGGYRQAFHNLSGQLLSRAAIIYINVSYAESRRKNRKRYNPNRPDSILEHALSEDKMERLYQATDWEDLSQGKALGTLDMGALQVPFVVFENEDDVSTPGGEPLGQRLEMTLGRLWQLVQALDPAQSVL
jgi:hypothetical protein